MDPAASSMDAAASWGASVSSTASSAGVIPAASSGAGADADATAAESADPAASTQPGPSAQTVACIGDSITEGYGLASPGTDAWPAVLQGLLGKGWNVVNLGVSGSTLMDEGPLPYRATGKVETAKQLAPDVVFIMLGTNDAGSSVWNEASYRAQLEALVDEMAASAPDARLVLMAPPRTFYEPEYNAFLDEVIGGTIRSIMAETASAKGATFVDLFALTESHPRWFPDDLHPNEEGHQAIAQHIYEQVF